MSGRSRRRRRSAEREAQVAAFVAVVVTAAAGAGKTDNSVDARATADDVWLADQVTREMALSGQPLTGDQRAAVLAEMAARRLAEDRGTDD